MYYYFHIQFKIPALDIYIVRVWGQGVTLLVAERVAKRIIINSLVNIEEDDFEIKKVVIPRSILSQFVFIRDIAQLAVVTHPEMT